VIRQKLKTGKPIKKLAAELAELSGWKSHEILNKLKSILTGGGRIWTDAKLRAEIQKQLKNGKPIRKVSPDKLAKSSGWERRDVKKVLNGMAGSVRWTEEHLRREIESRLENERLKDSTLARLVDVSGWKKPEIRKALHAVMETRKWTGPKLLDTLRAKLKATKSAEKAVAELVRLSGWKRQELKKLVEAQKWTEEQIRSEIEQQLVTGKSARKISMELAVISGWRKPALSRMFKAITETTKAAGNKKRITVRKELLIIVDPASIVYASKPLADFVKWQDSLLRVPGSKLYRVRKWGDPVMVKYGFDVNVVNTTNFQAVGLYNDGNREFGAVSNFIRISHEEVMRLKAMQIEDNYVARITDWRSQKMNWLCKHAGTIYFFDKTYGSWRSASEICWGTLALGGNLVQVVGTQVIRAKLRDGTKRDVEMARLQGFTELDWGRPLDDLLAEGLVHRCFCAYKSNHFGDSPKGIVYSPFFSPRGRDFAGLAEAKALYIPTEWLELKGF
jgi:hypothetical protein